jgi:hypothetical protein
MNEELEIWRITPIHSGYEVSSNGRLRNARTGQILKPRPLPSGYIKYHLTKQFEEYAHALVLLSFVGPRPTKKHQASHLNGDCRDNRLANLVWELPTTNNRRKTAHGTQMFGKRNPMGAKTHCKRGHEFNAANTRHADGKRVCRVCARDRMRRARAK